MHYGNDVGDGNDILLFFGEKCALDCPVDIMSLHLFIFYIILLYVLSFNFCCVYMFLSIFSLYFVIFYFKDFAELARCHLILMQFTGVNDFEHFSEMFLVNI